MGSIGGISGTGSAGDKKMRWGGLLENPRVSLVQRALLDSGRVRGLKDALRGYDLGEVIEVGCGLGDCCPLTGKRYVGFDNSLPRIAFAQKKYAGKYFVVADAGRAPVKDSICDTALLIDTAHHLPDDEFKRVLMEMARVSRKYVIVSDPVLWQGQGRLSAFFYSLDRGGCFRTTEQFRSAFEALSSSFQMVGQIPFWTFPRLYYRTAFVLRRS